MRSNREHVPSLAHGGKETKRRRNELAGRGTIVTVTSYSTVIVSSRYDVTYRETFLGSEETNSFAGKWNLALSCNSHSKPQSMFIPLLFMIPLFLFCGVNNALFFQNKLHFLFEGNTRFRSVYDDNRQ